MHTSELLLTHKSKTDNTRIPENYNEISLQEVISGVCKPHMQRMQPQYSLYCCSIELILEEEARLSPSCEGSATPSNAELDESDESEIFS